MRNLSVFDCFEAAATTLESKTCTEIIVSHLAPSSLQRSRLYFAHTYLGWTRSAVQSLGPNAQDSAKWRLFYIQKITFFHFFTQCILVTPMKLGSGIARRRGHLVCELDLKRLRPREMASSFRVWNNIFALFSKFILVISRNFVGTLLGTRGTLSVNLTSNYLDFGERGPF